MLSVLGVPAFSMNRHSNFRDPSAHFNIYARLHQGLPSVPMRFERGQQRLVVQSRPQTVSMPRPRSNQASFTTDVASIQALKDSIDERNQTISFLQKILSDEQESKSKLEAEIAKLRSNRVAIENADLRLRTANLERELELSQEKQNKEKEESDRRIQDLENENGELKKLSKELQKKFNQQNTFSGLNELAALRATAKQFNKLLEQPHVAAKELEYQLSTQIKQRSGHNLIFKNDQGSDFELIISDNILSSQFKDEKGNIDITRLTKFANKINGTRFFSIYEGDQEDEKYYDRDIKFEKKIFEISLKRAESRDIFSVIYQCETLDRSKARR